MRAISGGHTIDYAYDGYGRRSARTEDGATTRYLYGSTDNPQLVTGVREPDGSLTQLYWDESGRLFALQRGGTRYSVATDQVGTPRVVTAADGTTMKTLDFDSFGVQTADSAPGFSVPIGFAGGLRDARTGLVHLGAREYDPRSGRWTTRAPARSLPGDRRISTRTPAAILRGRVTRPDSGCWATSVTSLGTSATD